MKISCAFILFGVLLFVEVNSKAVEDPNNPPNELICKSLCDHCGLTGFYCGDECICETPEGQEENIQCLATMHSNVIELNVPWEIMIKGASGHYYLRDRLAEVIDEKMNESKTKLEEAERQAQIPKTKISVKKVNQLPKLKVKTVKVNKPVEEITIIREPRQIGEGNENFEDKTLLKIEEVAAAEPVAVEPTSPAVENAEPDAIVGAVAPAAVAPAATIFKPFTPIKLKPLRPMKIASLNTQVFLGDKKNLGARSIIIAPTTTVAPPTRRFGSILKQNFQNSKLGASLQNSKLGASLQSSKLGASLQAAKNSIVGDANPFANFKLGRKAAADSTLGAPAPDVGAPGPDVGAPAPDVGAPAPEVGAPAAAEVGAPPGVITQPAHTL